MSTQDPLVRLRRILQSIVSGEDTELSDIQASKDAVLSHYGQMFHPDMIPQLTADQFKSFLLYKNNRHWKSIHRQGGQMVEDMDALRSALATLLDKSKPMEARLKKLRPKGREPAVKGLARSVITPILQVVYPDRYGVLNQVAENALKELDLWPTLERGADFATKYLAVNEILLSVAAELEIDLWTLDSLWWRIRGQEVDGDEEELETFNESEASARFGLELHLHEFLRDNWDQTELGAEWVLHEEDGEVVGYKYNTGVVGEIDLLAHHRSEPRWLVVELKRGRTSDQAVGQALRYRGWVRRHLAEGGDAVEAVVIGYEADPKLHYALEGVEGVGALSYSVSFRLHAPVEPWAESDD